MACLLVGVCVAAGIAAGGVTATASDPIDVTFDEAVEDGAADLVAIDDHDDVGIGSYEIVISYDPDVVSLNATDTDRFTVVSDEREDDDDRVEKTIVGYTGETNTTADTLALADISVTAQSSGESELRIESIESLTDTDGTELAANGQNVTIETDEDEDGDNGGAMPTPDPIDDDEDDPVITDDDESAAEDEADEPTADDDDDTDEMDDTAAADADDDADDVAEEIPLPATVPLTALAALLGYGMYRSRGAES